MLNENTLKPFVKDYFEMLEDGVSNEMAYDDTRERLASEHMGEIEELAEERGMTADDMLYIIVDEIEHRTYTALTEEIEKTF